MKPLMHGAAAAARLILFAGLSCILAGCRPTRPEDVARPCQIYVTSDPSGASLALDGALLASAPATLQVRPGEHLLAARKPGYEEARITINARAGERIPVEMKLEPLRGLLLVQAQPEGADVEMNGVHYGKTPLLLPNFPLGRHQFRFSAPGYLPKVVEAEVPDRTPVLVRARLDSDAGRLSVETKPVGAQVVLNGADLGQTPFKQPRLPAGQHVLELALAGHHPYREEFTVKPGVEHKVNVTLTPLPGSLAVHTDPPGARIFLNNQYRGDAPFATNGLAPGQYVLRAELRGYATASATNVLPLGGDLLVELKLERASGTLLVSTEPPGVTVFLNGENRGVTAARGAERISEQMALDFIPPGRQTLQLTRQGYYDVTHTRMLAAGQTEIIHEKMRLRPVEFVPTHMIRTGEGPAFTFRGIIRERFSNGDIKLEIEPGIFKTFPAAEILEVVPLEMP